MEDRTAPASQPASLTEFLSADRPIGDPDEDRLNRKHFAQNIARIFAEWRGRDSLVVALYGDWGSGKTSLKNLVLKAVRNATGYSGKPTEILEFNPWEWSAQGKVSEAFFTEVSKKIGRFADTEKAKKAAKGIRAYASFFGVGRTILEGLPKALNALLLLIPAAGVLGVAVGKYLGNAGIVIASALAATAVAAFLGRAEDIFNKVADWRLHRAEAAEKALSEVKKDLTKALRELDRNLLVIIDDIDRLTKEEIRIVFQLVKANADFPNFIYFMPFQRDIVVEALDGTVAKGDPFLEKIVQIGFDLPQISQSDIDAILEQKLEKLFAAGGTSVDLDKERWLTIYPSGLRPYFRDLRRVNRFVSTLAFHVELMKHESLLEVNAVDLIALETLRLFEPKAHRQIRLSKELLLSSTSSDRGDKARRSERLAMMYKDTALPESVRTIVQVLFPNQDLAIRGISYDPSSHPEWIKRRQICTSKYFDRYFELSIPDSDISRAETDLLIDVTGDAEALLGHLRLLGKDGRLLAAIDQIEAHVSDIDTERTVPFLVALFEIRPDLPDPEPGFFTIRPDWTVVRVVRKMLLRIEDWHIRRGHFLNALEQTRVISIPMRLIRIELKEDAGPQQGEKLFDHDEGQVVKVAAVERLQRAAQEGTLGSERELPQILYLWAHLTNYGIVREWVAEFTERPENVVRLLERFTQHSVTSVSGQPYARVTWFIPLTQVEAFADIGKLREQVGQVSPETLNPEGKRALEAFAEAIRRRERGEPDEPVL